MTDLDLQHVIAEEIRAMLREEGLMKLNPTRKAYGGPSWFDEGESCTGATESTEDDWEDIIEGESAQGSSTASDSIAGTAQDGAERAEEDTGNRWTEYEVYEQEKPYKDDTDDAAQEDYIIVMIGDEDTDEEGCWIVEIQIVIGLTMHNEKNRGGSILANLMNQIYLRFVRKGWLDDRYEMEPEAHKRFNPECVPPEYEAALITKWKLPAYQREGLGELL